MWEGQKSRLKYGNGFLHTPLGLFISIQLSHAGRTPDFNLSHQLHWMEKRHSSCISRILLKKIYVAFHSRTRVLFFCCFCFSYQLQVSCAVVMFTVLVFHQLYTSPQEKEGHCTQKWGESKVLGYFLQIFNSQNTPSLCNAGSWGGVAFLFMLSNKDGNFPEWFSLWLLLDVDMMPLCCDFSSTRGKILLGYIE